jgi:hypothetical protein
VAYPFRPIPAIVRGNRLPVNAFRENLCGVLSSNMPTGTILEQMAAGIEMLGAATSQLQLDWQQPDDELREGDLLPVVTLSLRPALPEETR